MSAGIRSPTRLTPQRKMREIINRKGETERRDGRKILFVVSHCLWKQILLLWWPCQVISWWIQWQNVEAHRRKLRLTYRKDTDIKWFMAALNMSCLTAYITHCSCVFGHRGRYMLGLSQFSKWKEQKMQRSVVLGFIYIYICRIRKLRRAPETPGGLLTLKEVFI